LPRSKVMTTRRAFTILELLVILIIIAVLAALLVPGLKSAREKSRRSFCNNNLIRIGIACTFYSREHPNQVVWGTSSVFSNLAFAGSYLGSPGVLVCPSGNKKSAKSFKDPNASDVANVSYAQQAPFPTSGNGMHRDDVVFWDQGVAGNAC